MITIVKTICCSSHDFRNETHEPVFVFICLYEAKRNNKRKFRRKIIQNDDDTNRKILADILNFMHDEYKTKADPLKACEQLQSKCPVGYIRSVVRAKPVVMENAY